MKIFKSGSAKKIGIRHSYFLLRFKIWKDCLPQGPKKLPLDVCQKVHNFKTLLTAVIAGNLLNVKILLKLLNSKDLMEL